MGFPLEEPFRPFSDLFLQFWHSLKMRAFVVLHFGHFHVMEVIFLRLLEWTLWKKLCLYGGVVASMACVLLLLFVV